MLEIRHDTMDTTADTQAEYNRIYSNEGILLTDSFYIWLISLLHAQPGQRLIDISTGQGRLVCLARKLKLKAFGADFAIAGLRIGIKEMPGAGWVLGDGEQMPFGTGCADYITHIGSLEHYQDPQAGMREIARLLRPGGKACILLPNSYGLFGNINYVRKTGDIWDDGQPLQRYNTRMGWQRMLEAAGLTVTRVLKYEHAFPRTWADLAWYLRHPRKLARILISPLIPVNLGNQLVFICTKGTEQT